MNAESLNILAAVPEILLLVAACCVLLIEAIVKSPRRPSSLALALAAMAFPAAALIGQMGAEGTH